MELEDQFRYLVGGYYGVSSLDDYALKIYVLKDIENYIRDFIEINPIDNFNYLEEANKIKEEVSYKTKLQDALIVLPKINASMDLILLVKKTLKKYKNSKELE